VYYAGLYDVRTPDEDTHRLEGLFCCGSYGMEQFATVAARHYFYNNIVYCNSYDAGDRFHCNRRPISSYLYCIVLYCIMLVSCSVTRYACSVHYH